MLLACVTSLPCFGRQFVAPMKTPVAMTFEKRSSAPGLEWISEAFPEVLGQRMGSDKTYVLSREYRLHAYDGAPAGARAESNAAFQLQPSADVYVVLARVKLRENNSEGAAKLLTRALQLGPGNAEALALEQKLDGEAAALPPSPAKL